MAQHLATLREPLRALQPQPLVRPCYLAMAGGQVPIGSVLGIEYWLALVQYPVDVYGPLGAALADGYSLFLPIGATPFPFLVAPAQRAVLQAVELLPALRPQEPERETFTASRRLLAARGLAQAEPLIRPVLSNPDFVAHFRCTHCKPMPTRTRPTSICASRGACTFCRASRAGWCWIPT